MSHQLSDHHITDTIDDLWAMGNVATLDTIRRAIAGVDEDELQTRLDVAATDKLIWKTRAPLSATDHFYFVTRQGPDDGVLMTDDLSPSDFDRYLGHAMELAHRKGLILVAASDNPRRFIHPYASEVTEDTVSVAGGYPLEWIVERIVDLPNA